MKLLYFISIPIFMLTLGFSNPQPNFKESLEDARQSISQFRKHIETEIKNQKTIDRNKERLAPKFNNEGRERIRRGFRKWRERLDSRMAADYYMNSWFVASFMLDLDNETFLKLRFIYGDIISKVGVASKGSWTDEGQQNLKKINIYFKKRLRETLTKNQYEKLIALSNRHKIKRMKVKKGET